MKYSQNNEEEIVFDYFKNRPRSSLTFLDIGANDGVALSNTYALACMGWSGVRIEPDPIPFEKLELQFFPGKVENYNYALGLHNEEADFYQSDSHLTENDSGLLSTLKIKETKRWKDSQKFEKINVKVLTWGSFYQRLDFLRLFNFISIDAEGMDLDILRQLDLTKLGCEVLCIEYNSVQSSENIISSFCKYHGMRLMHKNNENLIYAR